MNFGPKSTAGSTIQNTGSTASVYAGYGGGSRAPATKTSSSSTTAAGKEKKGEVAELQK